jgi:hypothetical protein
MNTINIDWRPTHPQDVVIRPAQRTQPSGQPNTADNGCDASHVARRKPLRVGNFVPMGTLRTGGPIARRGLASATMLYATPKTN